MDRDLKTIKSTLIPQSLYFIKAKPTFIVRVVPYIMNLFTKKIVKQINQKRMKQIPNPKIHKKTLHIISPYINLFSKTQWLLVEEV